MQDEQTWLVKLDNGDVRMMDLDQLDAAFQSGTIHEDTLVRRDGVDRWMKLSEELGSHEEPPSPSSSVSTAPVALPSSHDAHEELEAMLRASRRRRKVIWGVVATAALGGLGAITVVNVLRLRPHGPVIADIPTVHVAAPSDPEPEQVMKADAGRDTRQVRPRRSTQPSTGGNQAPSDAPAPSVFKNGGDPYDPLNAKL